MRVTNKVLWKQKIMVDTKRETILAQYWCPARDLFGSQTPVTTEGFELQISCMRSRYLTH